MIEDTIEFATDLERDARTDTSPTYADYLKSKNRRLRQFREDLARDLPLFGAAYSRPETPATGVRPCYAGPTIGGVLAKIGPAPAPAPLGSEPLLVTDLGVMGQLIDQLL